MKKLFLIELADKLVTILGILLIGYGLYQIYPPICFVVVGCILAFPGIPRKGVD